MRQKLTSIINCLKPAQAAIAERKAKHEAAVAFSNKSCPPIFIYTMGKVGSSTVHKSLVEAGVPNSILHLHFLSENLPRHRKAHLDAGIIPLPEHIYLGEAVRLQLLKNKAFPIKIITLVRDPLAFTISNLFQNPHFIGQAILNETGSIDPQKAAEYINRTIADPSTFGYVYNWFDKELNAVFDIDVFAKPFPVEVGYFRYQKANTDVLVMRLEDLSSKGPQAIGDFLSLLGPLKIIDENVRTKSQEKSTYQQVVKSVSLDMETCSEIYDSKFVRHFYSQAMIDTFMIKWVNGSL